MKIIYLCQHFPPETGAPQIRVYEVSKELIAKGHQVEVITAFPHHPHGVIPEEYKGKFYMYEDLDNIPVHRTWIYPSKKGSFWKRLFSYFSFTFSSFYSIIKSKPTDVIICNSPPLFLGITGYIGAKLKRAKFVFNVADIWPESAVELGILKNKTFINMASKLEKFLYKKSWKIATATDGIKEYMLKHGKEESDVFVLPNGVNTEVFKPLPKNNELIKELDLEGKTVFTYAGTMGHAQGLEYVVRAAKIVAKKEPNVRLLFVGDGQEKEKLQELSRELNLDNIIFHETVPMERMPDIFSISDFSIVSLRNIELFKGARPSKIFPAVSTGTPVLYCGVGESAKIIEDNRCGEVAIPENPEAIAESMVKLMNISKEEYDSLSKNGRKLAVDEFSWSSIVEDLLHHISSKENVQYRNQ
jgi:glycosyltransferase involved in cell wall biosynthesis